MLKKLLFLSFVSMQLGAFAQTNSPYSAIGIGERVSSQNPVFSGMGNHFVTYSTLTVLNTSNPASYSSLRHQFPIFSIGLSSQFTTNQVGQVKENNRMVGISEIALGMSFAKRFGLAFGIKPVFRKTYDISSKSVLLGDSIHYNYIGKGSLNKAFIGLSFSILKMENVIWTVGGNAGGIFGTIEDERRSSLITSGSTAGGVHLTSHAVRSFHYDLGTILQLRLKKVNTFNIGATIEPVQKLKSEYSNFLLYAPADISDLNNYQYLSGEGDIKGKITLAMNYNAGISYTRSIKSIRKNGNTRTSQLMLMASYAAEEWSKYRDNYGDTSNVNTLMNSTSMRFGVQFIPEIQSNGAVLPKFFDRTNYRAGFYYNTLPYSFQNTQLTEWAVTVGLGMPILVDKRIDSSVQLGVGYGKRGTTVQGSFNQSFVTVNLGIFIAPGLNDRWFVKRKLD